MYDGDTEPANGYDNGTLLDAVENGNCATSKTGPWWPTVAGEDGDDNDGVDDADDPLSVDQPSEGDGNGEWLVGAGGDDDADEDGMLEVLEIDAESLMPLSETSDGDRSLLHGRNQSWELLAIFVICRMFDSLGRRSQGVQGIAMCVRVTCDTFGRLRLLVQVLERRKDSMRP